MELALIITAAALALAFIERQATIMDRKRRIRVEVKNEKDSRR